MRHVALALGLFATSAAVAAPCPTVMIILDCSGSMDQDPSGNFGSPSKLDLAKQAIQTLMMKYGDRIPFGLTTFQGDVCAVGPGDMVNILVEPAHDTKNAIVMAANASSATGGTNTLTAIQKVSADPKMHDPARPASYILLITDGEPTCSNDPTATINQIMAAATSSTPIKTFVVGFGALPAPDAAAMDQMATAGGAPCQDATLCNGHQFFAADNGAALNAAIDAISQQIAGEFGGVCDDSCYSNGCMNAGEICVAGKCAADPCANLANTCPPQDYCYTDGTSPGTCVKSCSTPCPTGQLCNTQGACVTDPCANLACGAGQTCRVIAGAGTCVQDMCSSMGCPPGLLCYQGECTDDPCRYVTCPTGTQCVAGTGACAASLTGSGGGGGGGRNRGGSGCDVGGGSNRAELIAAALLLASAVLLRARRRRAPHD